MASPDIHIRVGIPENLRSEAAALYDQAFAGKFRVAVRSDERRIRLFTSGLRLEYATAAIQHDHLIGLAGFHTRDNALTGGITYRELMRQLGPLQGNWAALVFSLYERKPKPRELVMDGIAVSEHMRGHGVGSRLLTELKSYAVSAGYETIRLDVIDTNPAARRLYEAQGFVATKTESFEYLRWLLGFGRSTTMIHTLNTRPS